MLTAPSTAPISGFVSLVVFRDDLPGKFDVRVESLVLWSRHAEL